MSEVDLVPTRFNYWSGVVSTGVSSTHYEVEKKCETLVNDTLHPILSSKLHRSLKEPLSYKSFEGLDNIDKVIEVDQSPLGRTPRSNPALLGLCKLCRCPHSQSSSIIFLFVVILIPPSFMIKETSWRIAVTTHIYFFFAFSA